MDWTNYPANRSGIKSRIQLGTSLRNNLDFVRLCIQYHRDSINETRSIAWEKTYPVRMRIFNHLRDSVDSTVVNPNRHIRSLQVSSRVISGLVGTGASISVLGWETFAGPRPLPSAVGIATGLTSSYFGLAKAATIISQDDAIAELMTSCVLDEETADAIFLSESLQFGSARRAMLGAELLADARWKNNIPLALDIAQNSLYALANHPKRHRRKVAKFIDELAHELDIQHPYRDIITSMGIQAYEISRLSDR